MNVAEEPPVKDHRSGGPPLRRSGALEESGSTLHDLSAQWVSGFMSTGPSEPLTGQTPVGEGEGYGRGGWVGGRQGSGRGASSSGLRTSNLHLNLHILNSQCQQFLSVMSLPAASTSC